MPLASYSYKEFIVVVLRLGVPNPSAPLYNVALLLLFFLLASSGIPQFSG
jgi:hypothetical protein